MDDVSAQGWHKIEVLVNNVILTATSDNKGPDVITLVIGRHRVHEHSAGRGEVKEIQDTKQLLLRYSDAVGQPLAWFGGSHHESRCKNGHDLTDVDSSN